MNNLFYNGQSLNNLGFAIKTKPFYPVAQRDMTFTNIAGRSGDILVDNGRYNNVEYSYQINSIPYKVWGLSNQELTYSLIDWLSAHDGKYKELRDSYNEGYFTKAICTNIADVANNASRLLDTTISFNRVPFWYSDIGQEVRISTGRSIKLNNPEHYTSEPLIRVYGSGDITIYTGNVTLRTTRDMKDYIEIDSESLTVSKEGVECSDLLYDCKTLPYFTSGENTIGVTLGVNGSFERIEVIPRWRRL